MVKNGVFLPRCVIRGKKSLFRINDKSLIYIKMLFRINDKSLIYIKTLFRINDKKLFNK